MSTADWYARKMREQQASPVTESPLPPTPVRVPPAPTARPATPSPMTYDPQQAQASRNSSACPKCSSGNFFKPNAQVAPRCYDCGYVDGRDYQQEAFTASSVNNTQAAKQLPNAGYSPSTIIGKIE